MTSRLPGATHRGCTVHELIPDVLFVERCGRGAIFFAPRQAIIAVAAAFGFRASPTLGDADRGLSTRYFTGAQAERAEQLLLARLLPFLDANRATANGVPIAIAANDH